MGVLGIVVTAAAAFCLNLLLGVSAAYALLGPAGPAILYGVLQIGGERKGWSQLEWGTRTAGIAEPLGIQPGLPVEVSPPSSASASPATKNKTGEVVLGVVAGCLVLCVCTVVAGGAVPAATMARSIKMDPIAAEATALSFADFELPAGFGEEGYAVDLLGFKYAVLFGQLG